MIYLRKKSANDMETKLMATYRPTNFKMATGRHKNPGEALFFILLWLFTALIGGCSWAIRPPVDDMAARRIVQTAARHNENLRSYKGLAKIQIENADHRMSGRIAIAAAMPNQMRVEWLSAIGQPLTSLAGDGETITIISYADQNFYRLRQSRDAFNKVVHLPISMEEMLNMLAGRPLLPQYAVAQMMQNDDGFDRVALKNRWHGVVAVLDMDPLNGRIISMKTYDGAGSWRYQVLWDHWRPRGKYTVASQVQIVSPEGRRLVVTMDRFWPDAEIAPKTFALKPPGKSKE